MSIVLNGSTGINKVQDGTITDTKLNLSANSQEIKDALNAVGSAPIYACRAWVNFNGTGAVAIRASGNVSSITDNGTGDYTVNFTTAIEDANYVVVLGGKSSVGDDGFVQMKYNADPTTSAVRLITGGVRNVLSPSDIPSVNVAVFR